MKYKNTGQFKQNSFLTNGENVKIAQIHAKEEICKFDLLLMISQIQEYWRLVCISKNNYRKLYRCTKTLGFFFFFFPPLYLFIWISRFWTKLSRSRSRTAVLFFFLRWHNDTWICKWCHFQSDITNLDWVQINLNFKSGGSKQKRTGLPNLTGLPWISKEKNYIKITSWVNVRDIIGML